MFGLVLVHRCTTHQELDELSLIHSKLDLNLHSGQRNIILGTQGAQGGTDSCIYIRNLQWKPMRK